MNRYLEKIAEMDKESSTALKRFVTKMVEDPDFHKQLLMKRVQNLSEEHKDALFRNHLGRSIRWEPELKKMNWRSQLEDGARGYPEEKRLKNERLDKINTAHELFKKMSPEDRNSAIVDVEHNHIRGNLLDHLSGYSSSKLNKNVLTASDARWPGMGGDFRRGMPAPVMRLGKKTEVGEFTSKMQSKPFLNNLIKGREGLSSGNPYQGAERSQVGVLRRKIEIRKKRLSSQENAPRIDKGPSSDEARESLRGMGLL
jgi:hypothetical protein